MDQYISLRLFLILILFSGAMACGPADDTPITDLETKEARIDFCEELADVELECLRSVQIDGKEELAREESHAIVDVEDCANQLEDLPDNPNVTVGEIRKCAETQIACSEPASIDKNFLLINCFPSLKE